MPQAPLIIVNPAAGAGRARRILPWLRERLAARSDARLAVTTRVGEAREMVGDSAGAHDRVVAVGGDGTIQEVINGLLESASTASLGILPAGSGNDLARSLRLPVETVGAWRAAIGRHEAWTDVARAQGGDGSTRWFASAGGVGFDAQVAAAMSVRRGWQRGRVGYLITTLAQLRRFDNREVRIVLDGEVLERRVLFVAITNGEYYGGGMRITPGARTDDGLLDLCVVGDISRFTVLQQMPNLYRGRHVDHPAVELRRGRTVTIEGDAGTQVHLDGELFGSLPLRVEMHRHVLNVAYPLR